MNHVSVSLKNGQVHTFQRSEEWPKLNTAWDSKFVTVLQGNIDGLRSATKFAIEEIVVFSSSELS